ncbi:helix-turn-helix domain-containing protein [Lysobacter sp. K5869]|uniref:YdaS family helix-turn-helix protein n=1 Tax=Lysobacter sp. K5869 TaxID=2820808 RepID=UPI001C05F96F|nr:YdaS family helix-turn-helix protein [Lysobacter sp. K5869]QWP79203.1 helix-turn-helix domain-containing protein [Lysobacter sp. K5869]
MSEPHPLEVAVSLIGGQAATGRLLDVSQSLVAQWIARVRDPNGKLGRPLPEEYCPALERASGVRCERLLPEVVWTRDTAGAVTGYHVPIPDSGQAA